MNQKTATIEQIANGAKVLAHCVNETPLKATERHLAGVTLDYLLSLASEKQAKNDKIEPKIEEVVQESDVRPDIDEK